MAVPFNLVGSFELFPLEQQNPSGLSVVFSNAVEPALIGAASSDGELAIVDLNSTNVTTKWKPHTNAITDASFLASNPSLILSASRDGLIGISDIRLPSEICRISKIRLSIDSYGADVWSVDAGGSTEHLLACSVENIIKAYDLRAVSELSPSHHRQRSSKNGLLWTFKDSHTDIVNFVRFHPSQRSLLVSGSDDNLIVFHDTERLNNNRSTSTYSNSDNHIGVSTPSTSAGNSDDDSSNDNEDISILGTFSNESPPRLIRFVGQNSDVLCVVSTTETFQAWECPNITTYSSMNDEIPVSPIIKSSVSVREANELRVGDSCGYIVDTMYDSLTERLFILGGSSEGRLILFHINIDSVDFVADFLNNTNNQQHTGIIRSSQIVQHPTAGAIFITGGEEGKMCVWKQ